MRNTLNPDRKFWQLGALVMVTAAAGLAAMWAPAVSIARWESGRLVEEGRHATGAEAQTDFTLASRLDPANRTALLQLARAQIAAGQPDDALQTLDKAAQGSEPQRLKTQTLVELGRYNAAADAGTALAQRPKASGQDLRLAALAQLLAGRDSDAAALAAAAPAQTAADIQLAASSRLALAHQLAAAGLNKSATAVLEDQPASYERNLMYARILYAHHSKDDLTQATDLLTVAVAANPSAIPARQLLVNVYQDRSNSPAAAQQAALIKHLQSGTP
jgi:hypothetical protein